jgi:GNAT superfamily N-acetyltransferase
MDIRIAAPSDATAICEVVRRSISECCHADHRGDPERIAAWLENKTPESILAWLQAANAVAVVAVRGGRVLGFALTNRDALALLYVVPEALYQGVGKALLRTIESRSIARGIATLRLESTRTAQDFYARHGFTVSGPVQVWAGMEGLPMVKLLVNHAVPDTER